MLVTLYTSALCPRCLLASRYLRDILSHCPEAEIKEIDVLVSPKITARAGIKMIPAIEIQGEILNIIYPRKRRISSFLCPFFPSLRT